MRGSTWLVAWALIGCGGSTDEGLTGSGGKDGGGSGGQSTGGTGGAVVGGSGGASTGGGSGGASGIGGASGGGSGGAVTGGSGGATGGSGGATGGTGGTGGVVTGGTGGVATGGTGGSGGTGACGGQSCFLNTCCDNKCVNTDNDIKNCGACGKVCAGLNPFCDNGTCKLTPPCNLTICIGTKFCCGSSCCDYSQLCCDVPGPVSTGVSCQTPVNGTCPMGCKGCVCNSPDTPIATPSGERAIEELRVGDLVYSLHRGAVRAVPVTRIARQEAPNHVVVELTLVTGVTLSVSPAHPTADGRLFADLGAGDQIDGVSIVSARRVAYRHTHTFDILPDSDTGTYYAGGVLIGSTITGTAAAVPVSGPLGAPVSR